MTERTCPSCGEPVAAHHTVCLACRTPVPSEPGPVAAGSGSLTFSAPPPRPAAAGSPDPAIDAPPPPGPDPTAVTWAPAPADAPPAPPAAVPIAAAWTQGPAPAADAATPSSTDTRGNLPAGLLGMLGALVVLVGIALPWITVGAVEVSGWSASDDAKALVGLAALAIVAAALLIGGARGLALRVFVLVLGVAIVAVAAYDVASVDEITGLAVDRGPGLFVVLAGGVLVTVSGVVVRHRRAA